METKKIDALRDLERKTSNYEKVIWGRKQQQLNTTRKSLESFGTRRGRTPTINTIISLQHQNLHLHRCRSVDHRLAAKSPSQRRLCLRRGTSSSSIHRKRLGINEYRRLWQSIFPLSHSGKAWCNMIKFHVCDEHCLY